MAAPADARPRVLVFSTLFPRPGRRGAGTFIRERMFRVGRELPLTVVVPVPWFPGQGLLRRLRPGFRPPAPAMEVQDGIEVHFPRFFSVPGLWRSLDGLSMAVCSLPLLLRLRRCGRMDLIDAHFAYPDGHAAALLGRWLRLPVTITLRGTEVPLARFRLRRRAMLRAIAAADRVFAVADALKRHVVSLGADPEGIIVVGNGVDPDVFQPVARDAARAALDLPRDAPVLVSVGGLVERKGFHRVMECLPALLKTHPGLVYLVVGGASPEGDWGTRLRQLAAALGVQDRVRFLGAVERDRLKLPLSAADCFVLATRNEGWANVFLEAMACGLPVVTTDVGGNREVVCDTALGAVVPFGDRGALTAALDRALTEAWDRQAIIAHARANAWDGRVRILVSEFRRLHAAQTAAEPA